MDVTPIDPFANYKFPAAFHAQIEQQMFEGPDADETPDEKPDETPDETPDEADPRDEVITQLQAAVAALTKTNAGLRAANAALILAAPTADDDAEEPKINPDDAEPEIDDLFK